MGSSSVSLAPSGVDTGGRRVGSLAAAMTFGGLALLVVVIGLAPEVFYVALSSVILGSFFVYVRIRKRSGSMDLFEFVIPFTLVYFVYFGVGSLYLIVRPQDAPDRALLTFIGPALALSVVGYITFLLGYATSFRSTGPSSFRGLAPTNPLVYVIPVLLGAAGMAVHEVQVVRLNVGLGADPILSVLQQFSVMFFAAWFLIFYAAFGGAMSRAHRLVVFPVALAAVAIVLFYTMGSKFTAILVITLPAVAYYYVRGHLPKKTLIVSMLIAMFVIVPIYNVFRLHGRELGTVTRLDRTVRDASKWNSNVYLDNSFFAFMKRMTVVSSVAAVLSDTGRTVDYRYGETLFLTPIAILVPRFVWPDKPNISLGREFGATFRLKDALDVETEISPSVVGEFYWNFGFPGVVVGMYLFGAAGSWVYRRYGAGSGFDPIRKATYIGILPVVLLFENNVAFLMGSVIKGLLIFTIYWIICRRLGWLRPISAPSATAGIAPETAPRAR